MIPEVIQQFIDRFSHLPSIGPRLATRLAFYCVTLDRQALDGLEKALAGLKKLNRCPQCFFLKDSSHALCTICSNTKRDASLIMIVEKETDLLAVEKTKKYHGRYFLLGELPDRGMLDTAQKLRIQHLQKYIKEKLDGRARELIISLNLNTFGDFVAELIKQEFKDLAEQITRIGRGIPTGGEIEFADEETLGSALERRN